MDHIKGEILSFNFFKNLIKVVVFVIKLGIHIRIIRQHIQSKFGLCKFHKSGNTFLQKFLMSPKSKIYEFSLNMSYMESKEKKCQKLALIKLEKSI